MELIAPSFENLVRRLYREPETQQTLFDLPERSWYRPDADTPDMRVRFHRHWAGNPLGPAAGPHTQMAQNLALSYIAGCRIMELKTVQVNDRLNIPRPCIDMTNVGYNVEWSQELLVPDSVHEYVAGMMLVEMLRHAHPFGDEFVRGPAGDVIYDLSVGYDLKGIQSDKITGFLSQMKDCREKVEELRRLIPDEYAHARELEYRDQISDSITLSTFHGCPADEIESICEYLISKWDVDVIVKMNPPMLGKERLEHLLYDVMGYRELKVHPPAYTSGLEFNESIELTRRLTDFAARRGRRMGAKFSNTLEVVNHRDFFTRENEVMYLSGAPLHPITLTLTDVYRQAVGPDVPVSFSAGVDQHNFAPTVACGLVPVTVSSDLLKTGGYGRAKNYFKQLSKEMKECGAGNLNEYILNRFGQADEARRLAKEAGLENDEEAIVRRAGWLNNAIAAKNAQEEPRYYAENNRKEPKKIDSHLVLFDCITCDKCIPVCPNDANFTYPTGKHEFEYRDVEIDEKANARLLEEKPFKLKKEWQIANYADFCNECGNCDTFCPEYDGPYIMKPSFFGSKKAYEEAAPADGFLIVENDKTGVIIGRIENREHTLTLDKQSNRYLFNDGTVEAVFKGDDGCEFVEAKPLNRIEGSYTIDVGVFHSLRLLREGVLDPSHINQVNVAFV